MSIKTDNSQTLVNALAEIDRLKGRVSELEEAASWCESENGDMQSLMALVRVVDRGCSTPWLLRKQAESVEAAISDDETALFFDREFVRVQDLEDYAKRLRQRADELENNNAQEH